MLNQNKFSATKEMERYFDGVEGKQFARPENLSVLSKGILEYGKSQLEHTPTPYIKQPDGSIKEFNCGKPESEAEKYFLLYTGPQTFSIKHLKLLSADTLQWLIAQFTAALILKEIQFQYLAKLDDVVKEQQTEYQKQKAKTEKIIKEQEEEKTAKQLKAVKANYAESVKKARDQIEQELKANSNSCSNPTKASRLLTKLDFLLDYLEN